MSTSLQESQKLTHEARQENQHLEGKISALEAEINALKVGKEEVCHSLVQVICYLLII